MSGVEQEIKIKKKTSMRGDDGHKIISVRMRVELLEHLEGIAGAANRSRNEVINLLLEAAVSSVKVEEPDRS